MEGLLQIAKNWQRSNDVKKNLEATTEAGKASNSSYEKNKADSGKARQRLIPLLVASLLIPKPNMVIVAKQSITIAKNNAKLMANNARNAAR